MELGFKSNLEKLIKIPSQNINHLDMVIKTRDMSIKSPMTNIRNLRREAKKLLNPDQKRLGCMLSFIGMAQSTNVSPIPIFLRHQRKIFSLPEDQLLPPSNIFSIFYQASRCFKRTGGSYRMVDVTRDFLYSREIGLSARCGPICITF
ncbi:hypothetical protein AYI68_g7539 [Smittium mucronatum]|uniref:Uncharacterized protein n=1 Tax=Smittium mucronatum TaxID=133383 RepID=A0A1R0GNE3_9FUNG|nr:hypothetical protein AYI68_g7539 [Smittium mucronatum]